ncbi:MAG TPA: SDR family oxidoreductase [Thermoanaerobaculia bacterium]|nr:SDR family oxidoreductase [Thermoanaerobaculia bacterium]
MRALIAGCGYVGSELGRRLVADGHRVWGLRRSADAELPEGVERVTADLTDAASLEALPRGLDTVVYASSAGGFTEERYRAAYADGPRNLLALLAGRGEAVRRAIFVSSTGVYGQQGGEWVDEESAAEADHFSAEHLRTGERLFMDSPGGLAARLGGIYGPGRTRLLERVRRGEEACDEAAALWTNRIHRDDAAGALAHLLTLPEVEPLYLVVDREPVERCELLRWLAERMGAPAPPAAENRGENERRGNKRCSSRRLVESGYGFEYPTYREGYGALMAS